MEYLNIFLVTLLSLVILFFLFRATDGLPINWPFVGTLPALMKNNQRIHQFIVEVIQKSQKTTFYLKGPWFCNMDILFTVDPVNIDHVFGRKFSNYVKGQHYREIFEDLGDGIINADAALWQYHRKLNHSFFSHPKFRSKFANVVVGEIETRLNPLFNHVSKNNIEIDLQDVFIRFTFDTICTILMNHNPNFLSIDDLSSHPIPFVKAVAYLEELIFNRHLVPKFIWKSLRWLGVGQVKYRNNIHTVDEFLYTLIAKHRSNYNEATEDDHNEVRFDLLNYMHDDDNANKAPTGKKINGDVFLRDTILSLIGPGGNTTSVALSWFFYVLSKNPQVTTKIRDELNSIMANSKQTIDEVLTNFNEHNNKLLFLHAAICETLRLYPPVSYNHKASIASDILPSGHQVHPNMLMFFDVYAMGRMKSIWGDDCHEFKPERWITNRGNIELVPSSKFLIFGAGPRICQGKDASMIQMKILIAAIVFKYDVEVVEGHQVIPDESSFILYLKHGLKVNIKPRLY